MGTQNFTFSENHLEQITQLLAESNFLGNSHVAIVEEAFRDAKKPDSCELLAGIPTYSKNVGVWDRQERVKKILEHLMQPRFNSGTADKPVVLCFLEQALQEASPRIYHSQIEEVRKILGSYNLTSSNP